MEYFRESFKRTESEDRMISVGGRAMLFGERYEQGIRNLGSMLGECEGLDPWSKKSLQDFVGRWEKLEGFAEARTPFGTVSDLVDVLWSGILAYQYIKNGFGALWNPHDPDSRADEYVKSVLKDVEVIAKADRIVGCIYAAMLSRPIADKNFLDTYTSRAQEWVKGE